jgi:hypothetical protein
VIRVRNAVLIGAGELALALAGASAGLRAKSLIIEHFKGF